MPAYHWGMLRGETSISINALKRTGGTAGGTAGLSHGRSLRWFRPRRLVRALASILGGPKAMSHVVVVLSTGASRQAGAPLMADFLEIAADLLRREEVKEAQDQFVAVFEGISRL
jgi:hypothetical protein